MSSNSSRAIHFSRGQLQHAFRHAQRMGIVGAQNSNTLEAFRLLLESHVKSVHTEAREGYYRNHVVTHFVNPGNRMNVMRLPNGEFLSAWILSPRQLMHVLTSGRLGGGK